MASNLEQLRLDIGDKEKVAVAEKFGVGDGVKKYFRLSMSTISANSEVITLDGVVQVRDTNYTIDNDLGLITMISAPSGGEKLLAQVYKYYAFSDSELNDILTELGNDRNKSAAHCCRVLATSAAKLFNYTSGDESVDRTAESQRFREMADNWADEGVAQESGTIDIAVVRSQIYSGDN